MKKLLSLILFLACLVLPLGTLTACGDSRPLVGIIQFGAHASLNNCYTGILAALADAGITEENTRIEHLDSNFSVETATAQAKKLAGEGARVIIAIATPAAIAAGTAVAASGLSCPVVYCAVTDAAQVANFSGMTGTSDVPDFAAQLSLVRAFFGRDALRIGVLMSTAESSDAAQLAALRAASAAYPGMEIVTRTVTDVATLPTRTDELIAAGVDCMVNLLDNTVVGQLPTILQKTDAAGIPVFGSEIEQVRAGCVASASIDYLTVGRLSGEQAAAVFSGTAVSAVAPRTMENETKPYYNAAALAKFPALSRPTDFPGLTEIGEAGA